MPRVPGPKHSTRQHPGRDLLEFCRDRENDVLRFTTDTRIWPTNNISERGVRPNKTQQKISGRLTSEDTTQDRLDIRSYIDTARKHGQHVLTVIRMLMARQPLDTVGSLPGLTPRPLPKTRHAAQAQHHQTAMAECLRCWACPARRLPGSRDRA